MVIRSHELGPCGMEKGKEEVIRRENGRFLTAAESVRLVRQKIMSQDFWDVSLWGMV